MPKILTNCKNKQIASIKIFNKEYKVIAFFNDKNINNKWEIDYYQVQLKRKKIANYNSEANAVRKMMAEAMLDINQLKLL